MRDTHHLLLLSLVAVPGCPETVPADDDGGSVALSDVCEEYVVHSYACNGEELDEDPERYCEEAEPYFEGYSDECQSALAEHMACLSKVDCETLNDVDASYETCPDTRRDGHHACPLLFPYCEAVTGSSGASPCIEGREACIDGKIYALECTDQTDGSMACDCKIDGESIAAFDVENASCTEYITQETFERCGFPEGV